MIHEWEPDESYFKARDKRSCQRKVGYRRKRDADQKAEEATRREGELVVVYHCSECKNYHLTKARNQFLHHEEKNMDWKNVKKVHGTNGILYIFHCGHAGTDNVDDIYLNGTMIAYKAPGTVYMYAKPGFHTYPHYRPLNSQAVKSFSANDIQTKLLEELLMDLQNPKPKKEEPKMPAKPQLSTIFEGHEVFYTDNNTKAFYHTTVICEICGKEEPGKIRLTVLPDNTLKSHTAIRPDNPDLVKPRPKTKAWAHRSCMEKMGVEIPSEEKEQPLTQTPTPEPETTVKAPEHLVITKPPELPFSEETILELSLVLDPKNKDVDNATARGAAWLFVREIVEKLMKK